MIRNYPIFQEPVVIWSMFLFVLCMTLWVIIACYNLLEKRKKNIETFVGFILEQNKLIEYSISNIRYHFYPYIIQNNAVNTVQYDIICVFLNPINLTTVRIYGIDGVKPTFNVVHQESHFVRLFITDIASNKFLITFNEKVDNELKRSPTQ